MTWARVRSLCLFFTICAVAASSAQAQNSPVSKSRGVSREDLQARLRAAESANRSQEAFEIRRRLEDGDFNVGDRIFLTWQSPVQAQTVGLRDRDTLVVQAGRTITLPAPVGDVNLTGVLYSEVSDTLNARIGQFFRLITVRATPLLRLSVSGGAMRPGFYYVPTDAPLSELITRAGGQNANGDLTKTEIHRGTSILWNSPDIQTALIDGSTIADLGLKAGDDVAIGEKKSRNWMPIFQVGVTVLTLVISVMTISR